jgi:hypothetical protein
MLDRTDHTRRLDRIRREKLDARKRERDQLRHYSLWPLDSEAAEVIANMRRIEVDPESAVAKDLKRLDRPLISRNIARWSLHWRSLRRAAYWTKEHTSPRKRFTARGAPTPQTTTTFTPAR